MSIDLCYHERFHLLDGLTSFEELRGDPELEQRFFEFMHYPDAAPAPDVPGSDERVPGPHGSVPVRIYGDVTGSDRPVFVWIHGGAFVSGDLDMPEADRTAREIAHRADAVVISVDYRLAVGGVTYPVPLDDCVAVLRWARDQAGALGGDRVTVGGASAGANLAAGATLRVRDEDGWLPAALLPVYGVFHAQIPPAAPALTEALDELPAVLRMLPGSTAQVSTNYLGGPTSRADGYAMPALADLSGLCPVVVVNAAYDDLRPSGQAFAAALATAGVDVRQVCAEGLLHGFLNLPSEIGPVERVLDVMAEAVRSSTRAAATASAPTT